METTTLIMLTGMALATFNALVVIACAIKSARVNQPIAGYDPLKPAFAARIADSLDLAA